MGIDIREQILARVFALIQSVPGVETVSRNRDQLPNEARPALVMWDADEDVRTDSENRGRLGRSTVRVTLKPEIYIVIGGRKPKNELIGEDINAIRVAVLKAILLDTKLQELVGPNGQVFYLGVFSDLAVGRGGHGVMGLLFDITYSLNPLHL